MQEKQRKSVCCCLFASTPKGRRRWLGRRKTKSYYIVGIIPIKMDMVSLKQISDKLSVLGKEEIVVMVSVRMVLLEGRNPGS